MNGFLVFSTRSAVTAIVLAVAAGGLWGGALASASTTCRTRIVESGLVRSDLQRAINLADPDDTIRVSGTCVGTFRVKRNLTLVGHATDASPRPTLSGGGAGTVLRSRGATTHLVVVGLTVKDGAAELGGGIRNGHGSLVVRHSVVRGNFATDAGGGIFSRGVLALRSSSVSDNRSSAGGGLFNLGGSAKLAGSTAIADNNDNYPGGRIGGGAGIYNDEGTVVVKDESSVTGNSSIESGGGIFNTPEGTVTLHGTSSVDGNYAMREGGGIYNSGHVTIADSASVAGNTAADWGGGVFNTGALSMQGAATIRANQAYERKNPHECDGGGVYNAGGVIVMNDLASIRANRAGGSGGGIMAEGVDLTMHGSASISKNVAGWYGGGVYTEAGSITMNGTSAIRGNTAKNGVGGGIFAPLAATLIGVIPGDSVRNNVPDDVYISPA